MRDPEYLEMRRAAIMSKIVESTGNERLKLGWKIMQQASHEEFKILRQTSREGVRKLFLEKRFGAEFAEIATKFINTQEDQTTTD